MGTIALAVEPALIAAHDLAGERPRVHAIAAGTRIRNAGGGDDVVAGEALRFRREVAEGGEAGKGSGEEDRATRCHGDAV